MHTSPGVRPTRAALPRYSLGLGTLGFGGPVALVGAMRQALVDDLLGAWLYEHGGFVPCLVGDALATAAIFPLLMRVPHAVLAFREGERVTDG